MARPKVIVYAEASVDGRLTVAPDVLLLFGDKRWPSPGIPDPGLERAMELHHPGAMLEGSGSFVLPGQQGGPLPPVERPAPELLMDYLPAEIAHRPGFKGWFTVVDGQGRIRWHYTGEPGKEAPGSEGWHLLVLVSRSTPLAYLSYLRRENTPYLVSGAGCVDLSQALEKMADRLEVAAVLVTSPGKLSGALIRAGLVDELDLLWMPIVIGGTRTPKLFESPELGPEEWPARLEFLQAEPVAEGLLWVRYAVASSAERKGGRDEQGE